MKVKGWAVVLEETKEIFNVFVKENHAITIKENNEVLYGDSFKVLPCTITIHDKAVGK